MVRQLQSLSHFSKNVCSVTTNNSLTRVVVTYKLDYRPGKSFRSWLPRFFLDDYSWLFKQKLVSNGSANSQPRTFSKLHSNSIKLMFCPWFVSTSWTLKLSHRLPHKIRAHSQRKFEEEPIYGFNEYFNSLI